MFKWENDYRTLFTCVWLGDKHCFAECWAWANEQLRPSDTLPPLLPGPDKLLDEDYQKKAVDEQASPEISQKIKLKVYY